MQEINALRAGRNSGQLDTFVSNLSSLTKKWLKRKKKLDKESCRLDADSGYCTARRCEAAIYEKCIKELMKIIKDC